MVWLLAVVVVIVSLTAVTGLAVVAAISVGASRRLEEALIYRESRRAGLRLRGLAEQTAVAMLDEAEQAANLKHETDSRS